MSDETIKYEIEKVFIDDDNIPCRIDVIGTKNKYFYTGVFENARNVSKAYQQGRADAIEPIKAIIQESEKMMWHSSKTLKKIQEQLKEQTE